MGLFFRADFLVNRAGAHDGNGGFGFGKTPAIYVFHKRVREIIFAQKNALFFCLSHFHQHMRVARCFELSRDTNNAISRITSPWSFVGRVVLSCVA